MFTGNSKQAERQPYYYSQFLEMSRILSVVLSGTRLILSIRARGEWAEPLVAQPAIADNA
jgi:hypothetical protein